MEVLPFSSLQKASPTRKDDITAAKYTPAIRPLVRARDALADSEVTYFLFCQFCRWQVISLTTLKLLAESS